jgi:hypothetical protein
VIRSIILFFYGIFVLLLVSRCANPVAPEGGKKDVTPPVVVSCNPPANTINFYEKNIRITFDEFLQLKDQSTQVNISPPLLPHTDIKLRGKSILVTLADTLKPNTTYSINFGDAITDLTENNILHGYAYIFSTGTYIDSLSLSGKIVNAFDLSPQKEVYAMLYINENDTLPLDSLPLHVPPYYMTKTRENGEFSFRNLRNVPYLLFGLKDMNGNFIANLPTEKIAFYDSLVKGIYIKPEAPDTLKKDSLKNEKVVAHDTVPKKDSASQKRFSGPSYTLNLFQESDSVQKILKADLVNEDQVTIVFRFPVVKPEFIPLNFSPSQDWMIPEFNKTSDSVFLWLNKTGKDSLYLRILDRNQTIDTARIDLRKKDSKKKKSEKGEPLVPKLNLTTNVPDNRLNQFVKNPVITFSYPLSGYDLSRILLVDGKDTVKPKAAFVDSTNRKLQVTFKWKEDHLYRLIIPDSIFRSINGRSQDTTVATFKTYSLRDLGSLQVDVSLKDPSCNYIIQLMNEKEKVFDQKSLSASGKIKFEYLFPGKYKVKAIVDRNRNGRWDTGNYSIKLEPETVKYFPKIIEIRANWDVDEVWEL